MDAFGRTYEDVSDGSIVPVYRAASARSTYKHFCEGANIITLAGSYASNAANIQSD